MVRKYKIGDPYRLHLNPSPHLSAPTPTLPLTLLTPRDTPPQTRRRGPSRHIQPSFCGVPPTPFSGTDRSWNLRGPRFQTFFMAPSRLQASGTLAPRSVAIHTTIASFVRSIHRQHAKLPAQLLTDQRLGSCPSTARMRTGACWSESWSARPPSSPFPRGT